VEPTVGYARLGEARIAYQIIGEGSIDLVYTAGSFGSFDMDWEDPMAQVFLRRLAGFARVIKFDRRGTGASDPLPLDALPPWESFVEELEAVMDSVGSPHAAIWAAYDAGPMGMLFAATKPERTTALILVHTGAKYLATPDYPAGITQEEAEELMKAMTEGWGTDQHVLNQVPSRRDDQRFRLWYAKKTRAIAGPAAARAYFVANLQADARALLPSIKVPTLIIHRENYRFVPVKFGRYLADQIAGSKLVELPGADGPLIWEHPDLALDAIEEFLTGIRPPEATSRLMTTVLFTDIVDSTKRAEEMGDRKWRSVLDVHDDTARRLVEENGGHVVKTTGDGVLATFDGPGRAIRAATRMCDQFRQMNLEIRDGIHTGEVEVRPNDVGGLAVHLAARVMSTAQPGEVLVSRTVRDLVAGSELGFIDRGMHSLKGFEGEWQLYAVDMPAPAAA
jgi:class 3 adenylate cyclase/pimeloyl-ACP methyl ester carboxylesterase